jgi:hypothetical protein
MTDASLIPSQVTGRPGADRVDAPAVLAEQHLMRRIVIATAIAVPIGALVFALLVAGAMVIAGEPVLVAAAMGAGIGVLAGSFFGLWAGFVASVSELDAVEHQLPEPTASEASSPRGHRRSANVEKTARA